MPGPGRAGPGRVGTAAFVCKQTEWKPLQGGRNAVRWKVKNKKTPSWQQQTWWCHQEHDVVLFWSRTSTLCWISLLTYCYFTSIKLFYCLLLYCFNTLDAVKRRNEDHSCCTDRTRLRWILDRDWLQRSYDVIKSRRFVKLRPKEKSQKLSSFSWWTLNSFCTLKNKLNKVVIIINLLILWSFNLVPLHRYCHCERYITTEGS